MINQVVDHLVKTYKPKELANLCYREVYDISKLYNVVYVGQVWDITDRVFDKLRIEMRGVRSEINNIE
tara:strand:- start:415 stop:618 length:204 start_codon:yes stop_codon:yes gene_type:complete